VNFIDSFLISLFDKKDVLARISHKLPTAAKDKRISTALRLKKVLNVLQVRLRAFSFTRLVSTRFSAASLRYSVRNAG